MKDFLFKFREKITKSTNKDDLKDDSNIVNLDEKIDQFIKWNKECMVENNNSDIEKYYLCVKLKSLIEKIAIWYELRYSDYEVNRLIDYNKEAYDDWNSINMRLFIKSLPIEDRIYFSNPKYRDIVYLEPKHRSAHLHLTDDGFVESAEDISNYTMLNVFTKPVIKDEELTGMHLKEVVELFKNRGISLPENNELEQAIEEFDNLSYQREGMLNCAMYRIIERGGRRMGPRRAFLFAKEFNRNKDIPMKYAVDYSDAGLRTFINEYLKSGGVKDLECYIDYFSSKNKNDSLDTISIQELIITKNHSAKSFYTPEEDELHQRLINTLSNHAKVKQLTKKN